jgi:UDP-glucose 4-epimerase
MKTTILVCGAAGFIGRNLVRVLKSKGFSVIGLGRGVLTSQDQHLMGLSAWNSADVSIDSLHAVLNGEDPLAIIQCAGTGSVSAVYNAPHDAYISSVGSIAGILEYVRTRCRQRTRVVYISSSAVYGAYSDGDSTESSPCQPISPYGFLKLAAEELCRAYNQSYGVRVAVVRPFSVYGNGLRKQLLWDAMNKLISNQYSFLGTGHELRDWIHVDDVSKLLCDVATDSSLPDYDVFNASHSQRTVRDILQLLAFTYDHPRLQPVFTGAAHTGNPHRLTGSSEHARETLGWSPSVDLEQGLSDYVQWFHQQRCQ